MYKNTIDALPLGETPQQHIRNEAPLMVVGYAPAGATKVSMEYRIKDGQMAVAVYSNVPLNDDQKAVLSCVTTGGPLDEHGFEPQEGFDHMVVFTWSGRCHDPNVNEQVAHVRADLLYALR